MLIYILVVVTVAIWHNHTQLIITMFNSSAGKTSNTQDIIEGIITRYKSANAHYIDALAHYRQKQQRLALMNVDALSKNIAIEQLHFAEKVKLLASAKAKAEAECAENALEYCLAEVRYCTEVVKRALKNLEQTKSILENPKHELAKAKEELANAKKELDNAGVEFDSILSTLLSS